MNLSAAHIHIMINHLPIIGMPILVLLLLIGLLRQSAEITRLALGLTVLLALGTIPVYLTGDPAHEQIEHEAWYPKQIVHEHEEKAETAFIAVLVTGGIAVVALWLMWRSARLRNGATLLVLLALLASCVLLAIAAEEGGEIRHTEVRPGATTPATLPQPEG